jgi:hypothetical protein
MCLGDMYQNIARRATLFSAQRQISSVKKKKNESNPNAGIPPNAYIATLS